MVTAKSAASTLHVESALREMQREARLFQLRALKEMNVRQPTLAPPIEMYPRSRVDLLDVYSRPARDAAQVLAGGGSEEAALKAFEKRLEGVINADVAAAERDETQRVWDQLEDEGITDWLDNEPLFDDENPSELMTQEEMREYIGDQEADAQEDAARDADLEQERQKVDAPKGRTGTGEKVIGFRRVIRPELSKYGSCGLCVVAATNWYTRKNLKAIHNLCKCVTLPVTATQDPGFEMNQQDLRENLDAIYGVAGGTAGKKLKRTRVSVREHGELGPMLVYSAKNGWQPREGAKPYTPPNAKIQRARVSKRVENLKGTLENLRSRVGGDGDQAGLRAAIWETEQAIRDATSRLAA